MVLDSRETLIHRSKPGKNGQERSGRRRFNDDPLPFLSDNDVVSGEFELARNSDHLIAAVLE